jgi:hypothetical protein
MSRSNEWSWSKDERTVVLLNHVRGNSLQLSARILGRSPVGIRHQEYDLGLHRSRGRLVTNQTAPAEHQDLGLIATAGAVTTGTDAAV